jgi:hypothetical protein
MSNKRHKQEEIVQKLRQVDVLVRQGMTLADAIRAASQSSIVVQTSRDFGVYFPTRTKNSRRSKTRRLFFPKNPRVSDCGRK